MQGIGLGKARAASPRQRVGLGLTAGAPASPWKAQPQRGTQNKFPADTALLAQTQSREGRAGLAVPAPAWLSPYGTQVL